MAGGPTFDVVYKRLDPYGGWEPPNTSAPVTIPAPNATAAMLLARQTYGFGTFTATGTEVCPYPTFIIKSCVPTPGPG